MHGRPRSAPKPDEQESAAKTAKLRGLQTQVLQNHHNKLYDKEGLDVCAKLLGLNPEVYTGWNYRKLAVESLLGSAADDESVKSIIDGELRVVEMALNRNPKCYAAWHHRKWVWGKGQSLVNVDHEFRLLENLFRADARNFNGWNYRRFVAGLKNISAEEELKFTTKNIDTNFSNYSAWHNRSILLSPLLLHEAAGFGSREKVLKEELDLIQQAIFTDPDDQSGWFYQFWLLRNIVSQDAPVIISSWPSCDSTILMSSNMGTDELPIILYFSQPVGGLSSSTITVTSVFQENEHLLWTPLTTNRSGKAHAWLTYLKIQNMPDPSYPIKVCVGSSQGIISSSGSHFNHPYFFEFTVNLHSYNLFRKVNDSPTELYSWTNEKFGCIEDHVQELSSVIHFDRLKIIEDGKQAISQCHREILENEIALSRELLDTSECKIGMLTLARLLMVYDGIMPHGLISSHEKTHCKEILELYANLMKMDPVHYQYYKDMHSLILLELVTLDSLMKHCRNQETADSSHFHFGACLCLKKLSISRFGFVERLLWVQVLDLSHNKIQTVEGLEAMQLLKCLNLSNNKICSFSALEPLKLIRSLIVLDISFNEIGLHSIDTNRYLCSSPLPHSTDANLILEAYGDAVMLINYWEAALIFKDLTLVQLDVAGNAVSNKKFKKFLLKVLPCLKWLDGKDIQ